MLPASRGRQPGLAAVVRRQRRAFAVAVQAVSATRGRQRGVAVQAVHRGGSDLPVRARGTTGRASPTAAGFSDPSDGDAVTGTGSRTSSSSTPQSRTAQMTSRSRSLTTLGLPDHSPDILPALMARPCSAPSDQLPLLTLNACDLIGQQIGNLALPFDDALLLENQELVERSL